MSRLYVVFIAIASTLVLSSAMAYANMSSARARLMFEVATCVGYYDAFAGHSANAGRYDLFQEWDRRYKVMSDNMIALMLDPTNIVDYDLVIEHSLRSRDEFRNGTVSPDDTFKMATMCPAFSKYIEEGNNIEHIYNVKSD